MKSTGFGRHEQTIILRVPVADVQFFADRLGASPEHEDDDEPTAKLVWKRLSVRLGNDEDVVTDIWHLLGKDAEIRDWHIDWQASKY